MAETSVFSCTPSSEFPGWHTWDLIDPSRYNGTGLGPMLVRVESERTAIVRLIEPGRQHSNVHDNVHGGVTLGLIDTAMFAAMFMIIGESAVGSVTLELHNQFIGAGRIGQPLDVEVEIMKETGRLVFLRGTVIQDDHLVSSFSGTLRKPGKR